MTTRPNLGGLFNGSTPPDRSSGISGSTRPRLVTSSADSDADTSTKPVSSPQRATPEATPGDVNQTQQTAFGWADPVKAVERYFEFLAALLEANKELAVAVTTTLTSLPLRVSSLGNAGNSRRSG